MVDWGEEEQQVEQEEVSGRRVLDQEMIQEPIRHLDPRPPVCVERTSSVAEAIRRMVEDKVGCVLVCEGERLAGIFTERDLLLRVVAGGRDPQRTPVAEVMTEDPEVLSPDDAIVFALNKMSVGGFRHVPLVDAAGRAVGVLSVKHVVDYVVDFFPREVLNLPPEPGKDVARDREGA